MSQISIIAVYGLQESEHHDIRTEFYSELSIEVQASLDRGSTPVLLGDFNAKLSHVDGTVSGVSSSGILLADLVKQHNLKVLNFDKLSHGKWTRVQKKNDIVESSVIDYAVTTESAELILTSFEIDEERLFSPFWIRSTTKLGQVRQYSDHNPILLTFQIPRNDKQHNTQNTVTTVETSTGWKLTTQGLQKFKELSELMAPLLSSGVEIIKEFDASVSDMMDSCFTKKQHRRTKHPNVNSDKLIHHRQLHAVLKICLTYLRKGRTERTTAKKYIQYIQDIQDVNIQTKKSRTIAETLEKLTDQDGQLTTDKFWKMKKSLSCPDRSKASITSRQGVELFSQTAITKEYAQEFYNRLSHKPIDPSFKEYECITQSLFKVLLQNSTKRKEPEFTIKEVKSAALNLNAPSSSGSDQLPPDIFKNAGHMFYKSLTKVLNAVKEHLWIPPKWYELIIVTIFKNKGSRKLLEYYRGIFLSNIITKILEKVIKNRIKPLLNKINPLQAGSQENKCTCDSLFLVYGVIDHAKYLKKQIFITLYDYSTCFDSIWLEDSMISLWDLGVRSDLFALVYKLNEVAKIRVKTPFGMTEEFDCPRIVKQGSVLSSNLCSSSTAQICDQNMMGGVYTGTFVINDVLYVDDTTDLNDDINETVESNQEIVNFAKSKRLSLNHPKCGLLTINKKPHHSNPTLKIGDGTIPQIKSTKLLGDIINEKGNNADMIDDKVKKAQAALINCLSLCNEVTLGLFFAKSALILYRSVFLATLLFNSQSWRNLTKAELKKLEVIQLRFLKRIMKAPISTPNSFVFLEFGELPVSYIIHSRQLGFLHHIHHLNESDPVKKMYNAQLLLPFEKNWANEVNALLGTYSLNIHNIRNISKDAWKRVVKQQIEKKAFDNLTLDIHNKSKTKHLQYDSFESQQYIASYHHKQASIIFKLRSRSIDCKANRKSSNPDLSCRLCHQVDETQGHIVNCPNVTDGPTLDMSPLFAQKIPPHDPLVMHVCSRVDKFNSLVNNDSDT